MGILTRGSVFSPAMERPDEISKHPERHIGELSIDAPGAGEGAVVPWPLMLRARLQERVAGSPRYPWLVLAVSLFGLFSVGFTITILSVSVPRIAEELNSDASTVTWVVTGPLLAFAVVGPAMGKLGDLYGHRRLYENGRAAGRARGGKYG